MHYNNNSTADIEKASGNPRMFLRKWINYYFRLRTIYSYDRRFPLIKKQCEAHAASHQ
jgi:hypothetical protein